MTKVTVVQKDELLSLTKQFGNELSALKRTIDDTNTKYSTITDRDGMSFSDAASTIKNNLTNIFNSLQTLCDNSNNYIMGLRENDKFEKKYIEDEFIVPSLSLLSVGINTDIKNDNNNIDKIENTEEIGKIEDSMEFDFVDSEIKEDFILDEEFIEDSSLIDDEVIEPIIDIEEK